jgi:hypothetical protein
MAVHAGYGSAMYSSFTFMKALRCRCKFIWYVVISTTSLIASRVWKTLACKIRNASRNCVSGSAAIERSERVPLIPEKKTKSPVSSPGEKCQSLG